MDPLFTIQSIIAIGVEIHNKLKEYKDLPSESSAVSNLVQSVESVLKRAADDAGLLSQSAVIGALKGVEESLAQCNKVISKITKKNKFITFFMAGIYVSDLKAASTRLANQLGIFQAALGVDLKRDTRQEFQDVRQGLVNMELNMLRHMEEQAASFRHVFDQQVARGSRDDDQLRRVLQECLTNVGMGASCISKEDMDKAIQECKQEMDKTIKECKLEKQNLEAAYLEEISKLLLSMQQGSPEHENAAAVPTSSLLTAPAAAGNSNSCSSMRSRSRSLSSIHMDVEVPRSFLCPITLSIMRDPVMLVATGHSFEREAIERHLAMSSIDPLTNKPLYCTELMTNFRLQEIIQEWLAANGLWLAALAGPAATSFQQPETSEVQRKSHEGIQDKGPSGESTVAAQPQQSVTDEPDCKTALEAADMQHHLDGGCPQSPGAAAVQLCGDPTWESAAAAMLL